MNQRWCRIMLGVGVAVLGYTCQWTAASLLSVENWSGRITPEENRTFVPALGNLTRGSYTVIVWSYSVESAYDPHDPKRNPTINFRHSHQPSEYGSDSGCYSSDYHTNLFWDPRILTQTPCPRTSGLDRECREQPNGRIRCEGSFPVGVGKPVQWYVAAGFECGYEQTLDLSYNITVSVYSPEDIPCTEWSDAFNELPAPIAPGLLKFTGICSLYYSQFSRWNVYGLSQYDMGRIFTVASQILSNDCYQHFTELACRALFPECSRRQLILPCHQSCQDFVTGCGEAIWQENNLQMFNFSCTSLSPNLTSGCRYKQVKCLADPPLPSKSRITYANGSCAEAIRYYKCQNIQLYSSNSHGKAVCGYNGEWRLVTDPDCLLLTWSIVLLTAVPISLVIILVAFFCYEVKLLCFTYCACLWRCVPCLRRRQRHAKLYHAFLLYYTNLRPLVDTEVASALRAHGYQLATLDTVLPGERELHRVSQLIAQCHYVVIFLNQQLLDSYIGTNCIDDIFYQSMEDASLKCIHVLMDSRGKLKNVPPWIRAHLNTRLYIKGQHGDSITDKIRAEIRRNLPVVPNETESHVNAL